MWDELYCRNLCEIQHRIIFFEFTTKRSLFHIALRNMITHLQYVKNVKWSSFNIFRLIYDHIYKVLF